jgi:hypothetical protein
MVVRPALRPELLVVMVLISLNLLLPRERMGGHDFIHTNTHINPTKFRMVPRMMRQTPSVPSINASPHTIVVLVLDYTDDNSLRACARP